MGMNAQRHADLLFYCTNNLFDFRRQCPAVGIAQHNAIRSGLFGRQNGFQSIFRVTFISIKKMFGIVNHLTLVFLKIGDRIGDHFQILLEGSAQHVSNVKVPALSKDSYRGSFRSDQFFEILIFCGLNFSAAGRTERGDRRVLPLAAFDALEIFLILRIGTRPSALDVMDAQFIEFLGDLDLVLHCKRDPLGLGTVAQCRIVYGYLCH